MRRSLSSKTQDNGNTDFSQAIGSGMDNFLKTPDTSNQPIYATSGLELPTRTNPNPKSQASNITPVHASINPSQQQSVYDATTSFSNKQQDSDDTDKPSKITFGNLVRKQWD